MNAVPVSSFLEILALFLLPLAIMSAIEKLFLDRTTRGKLASYVFGYSDVSFKDFEANVTIAALGPFCSASGRIRYWRVLLLSPISFLISVQVTGLLISTISEGMDFAIVIPAELSTKENSFFEVPLVFMIALIVTSPFDYLSIWITKKVFVDKSFGNRNIVALIGLDSILSGLPCLVVLGGLGLFSTQLSAFGSSLDPVPDRSILLALGVLLIACASLYVVTILQILILTFVVAARALFRLLRFNQPIGLTPASDQPLSFIGFILGLTFVLLYLL